ncbi:hypothetical protein Vafri_19414, partial [Volvox africanus]
VPIRLKKRPALPGTSSAPILQQSSRGSLAPPPADTAMATAYRNRTEETVVAVGGAPKRKREQLEYETGGATSPTLRLPRRTSNGGGDGGGGGGAAATSSAIVPREDAPIVAQTAALASVTANDVGASRAVRRFSRISAVAAVPSQSQPSPSPGQTQLSSEAGTLAAASLPRGEPLSHNASPGSRRPRFIVLPIRSQIRDQQPLQPQQPLQRLQTLQRHQPLCKQQQLHLGPPRSVSAPPQSAVKHCFDGGGAGEQSTYGHDDMSGEQGNKGGGETKAEGEGAAAPAAGAVGAPVMADEMMSAREMRTEGWNHGRFSAAPFV